jgi:hypothetical protein
MALKYGAGSTTVKSPGLTNLSETNIGSILHRTVQKLRSKWEVGAMNDDFLKNYTKRPRSSIQPKFIPAIRTPGKKIATMRKLALSFMALMIVFTAVFAASPTVRAATLQFLREIGGLSITVSEEPPPLSADTVVPPSFEDVTLAEAQARFDGPISLPDTVPDGFELQPEVRLTEIAELEQHQFARLAWRQVKNEGQDNETVSFITLEIDFAPGAEQKPGYVIGQSGLEEIDLNGQQAVLIRGVWDHERQETTDAPFIFLVWKYDEATTYTLSANSNWVETEDLLAMARSIH